MEGLESDVHKWNSKSIVCKPESKELNSESKMHNPVVQNPESSLKVSYNHFGYLY